jgi:hypothetical protein
MLQHYPFHVSTLANSLTFILILCFFELVMWVGILMSGERRSPLWDGIFFRLKSATASFVRYPALAVAAFFLLVFVGRLAMLPVAPVPAPKITDEFSQLLSADTFASGRVTNPTHPMWFYFETFFVNQKPTYHSMYPPATGLFMGAAQFLTGQPWYGMVFAVAAAAGAMCWMLQGWVPPRWALWGTMVFVLLGVKEGLTEGYLGEGLVVLGGALVLGAAPRIVKKKSVTASVWLGVGIALLATTRPYEGAFLTVGILAGTMFWGRATGMRLGEFFAKVAAPAAAIVLPVLAAAGYLNYRSTGSWLLAPYQLNLVQQHLTRPFVWQKLANPPPHYDHAAMASFYEQWELHWWKDTHSFPKGLALFFADKANDAYLYIIWPLALLAAMGCHHLFKNRFLKFLPLAFILFLAGLSLETYQLLPRYVEAAWGLLVLLAVYGMRYAGVWERKGRRGQRISRAAAVLIPMCIVIWIGVVEYQLRSERTNRWYDARREMLQRLEALPGKQLVVVRYSPSHLPLEEWVANRADIDAAKVVWARDSADHGDAELLRYFSGRTAWLLEPDGPVPKLTRLF